MNTEHQRHLDRALEMLRHGKREAASLYLATLAAAERDRADAERGNKLNGITGERRAVACEGRALAYEVAHIEAFGELDLEAAERAIEPHPITSAPAAYGFDPERLVPAFGFERRMVNPHHPTLPLQGVFIGAARDASGWMVAAMILPPDKTRSKLIVERAVENEESARALVGIWAALGAEVLAAEEALAAREDGG